MLRTSVHINLPSIARGTGRNVGRAYDRPFNRHLQRMKQVECEKMKTLAQNGEGVKLDGPVHHQNR